MGEDHQVMAANSSDQGDWDRARHHEEQSRLHFMAAQIGATIATATDLDSEGGELYRLTTLGVEP